jgi:DNA phosphorothioation-associated DGQHR protein 1
MEKDKKINYPINAPALKVVQPLGEFYVTKLSAKVLLEVTYSDPLRIIDEIANKSSYPLIGAQREESEKRIRDIGKYIDTVEAAFPNSIILAANYNIDGELAEDNKFRWQVKEDKESGIANLKIPTGNKLASIIDGQHRLHGFKEASTSRLSMELLCAIYLDLPNPYQAYLFATINSNQKKVDRSLAYELWGFNLETEPAKSWSPEKTAVYLCRKLNTEDGSPFHQHIIIAAQNDEVLFSSKPKEVNWVISTATVVDGILKLISSNAKRDKDEMHKVSISGGRNRKMLIRDRAPFRKLYLETNDKAIYTAIKNFFLVVSSDFWPHASNKSYIKKTVGIQALFDVLCFLMKNFEQERKVSIDYFKMNLSKAKDVDFSDVFFQASGIGKTRIKNIILFAADLKDQSDLPPDDLKDYKRLAKNE